MSSSVISFLKSEIKKCCQQTKQDILTIDNLVPKPTMLQRALHTYIIIHFPKLMAGMEIPFKPPFARPIARRPPPTATAPTTAFVAIRFPRSAVLLRPEE